MRRHEPTCQSVNSRAPACCSHPVTTCTSVLTQITWTFKKSNFQLHQPATRSSNPPHAPPLPSTSQLWHLVELTASSCCPAALEYQDLCPHQDLLLQHYQSALEKNPNTNLLALQNSTKLYSQSVRNYASSMRIPHLY